MNTSDPNIQYWSEYSNLQRVKHDLIKKYLNGWFPKMTLGATGVRHLLYIDTHAGRGKHLNGQLGSPLVALQALLNHSSQTKILEKTRVSFHFLERDADNLAALEQELEPFDLPPNISVVPQSGDGFQIIADTIEPFEKGGVMPPAFVFLDPFGFKLPGQLLRKLLTYPKVELFINVMWRELNMAMCNVLGESTPPSPARSYHLFDEDGIEPAPTVTPIHYKASLEKTLDTLFDGNGWRKMSNCHADERADECAALFKHMTGAIWGTHLRMMDNGTIRYFLLHLSNNAAGRNLMKECMWDVCPSGGFVASKSDNPNQKLLIKPEPNLDPLRDWLIERLELKPMHWRELAVQLLPELWLDKHLNCVIKDMVKSGVIVCEGKCAETRNPLLKLSNQLLGAQIH